MIDRLWPDKLPIADICLAISKRSGKSFGAAVRREVLRRKLRDYAKRIFYAVTGRHRS